MSQVIASSSSGAKKRKHGATDHTRRDESGVASTSRDAEEPSAKRSKKDKKAAHAEGVSTAIASMAAVNLAEKKKDKKKNKHKSSREGAGGVESEFHVVSASVRLSIPPIFAPDLPAGARELLDSMLMRYLPALQGVLLAHDRLRFVDDRARIKGECPFAICRVTFDAVVWRPRVGMRLVGKLSLSSPDHISLLLHRTFNVSIPRHQIPVDEWVFEYGPAENDPEFGAGTAEGQGEGEDAKGEMGGDGGGGGWWVHKVTGINLGDVSGSLEFTVVGLTIANQMLSLVGSLHSDPFSPAHVPATTSSPDPSQSRSQPARDRQPEAQEQGNASDEEEDTFGMLGRMGDEAVRREAEMKAEAEAKIQKEKKKRRKEGREAGQEGERKHKKKKV